MKSYTGGNTGIVVLALLWVGALSSCQSRNFNPARFARASTGSGNACLVAPTAEFVPPALDECGWGTCRDSIEQATKEFVEDDAIDYESLRAQPEGL